MKLYTFYTNSHRLLFEVSVMSLKYLGEEGNTHIAEFEQKSKTGDFHSEGWNETMADKLEYILYSVSQGHNFIHADADIIYFKRFRKNLQFLFENNHLDLLFQADSMTDYCMGFFVCKPSKLVKILFEEVLAGIKSGRYINDQIAVNDLIRSQKYRDLRVGLLGPEFYSIWRQTGGNVWKEGDTVNRIETPICMLHANWTIGVNSKLALMDAICDSIQRSTQMEYENLPRLKSLLHTKRQLL